MNIPEKVRAMDNKGKLHYFLDRLADTKDNPTVFNELIGKISEIMSGTPIDKISEVFDLEVTYPEASDRQSDKTPITIQIKAPTSGDMLSFDIVDLNKKQFKDPQPVEMPAVRSQLSDDDKKDILETAGIKIGE